MQKRPCARACLAGALFFRADGTVGPPGALQRLWKLPSTVPWPDLSCAAAV